MGIIRGAVLAVGAKGRAFVVWNGSDTALPRDAFAPASEQKYSAAPLLFARLNDSATTFEPQPNLMTRSLDLDGGASVAADEQDRTTAFIEARRDLSKRPLCGVEHASRIMSAIWVYGNSV